MTNLVNELIGLASDGYDASLLDAEIGDASNNYNTDPGEAKANYFYATVLAGELRGKRIEVEGSPPGEAKMRIKVRPTGDGTYYVIRQKARENSQLFGGNRSTPDVPGHASLHHITGRDPVTLHINQIEQLRPVPVASGLTIKVKSGAYGDDQWFSEATIDLTSNVPSSGTRWVGVEINASGALAAINGAVSTLALPENPYTDLTFTNEALCAVKLRAGQTAWDDRLKLFQEGRFIDLRSLLRSSGGGGGSIAVQEVDGSPSVSNVSAIVVSNGTLTDDGSGQVTIATGGSMTVQEVDGSPSVSNVTTLVVSNGTLTDDGSGQVTIATGGGGGGVTKTRRVGYQIEETLASDGSFDIDLTSYGLTLSDYDDIEVIAEIRSDVASTYDVAYLKFNNDSTASNYRAAWRYAGTGSGGSSSASPTVSDIVWGASATANRFTPLIVELPNFNSSIAKDAYFRGFTRDGGTSWFEEGTLNWDSTAAITRIQLEPNGASDDFVAGSKIKVILWGNEEIAAGGIQVSTANVSNPPTDAELDTEFGTPATVGAGFQALLEDNGAGSNVYLVASDGSNWWHTAMTKAT